MDIRVESVFDHLERVDADAIYLDPPYVAAGPALYRHCFGTSDHYRLVLMLNRRSSWVLSYDNDPWVRETYEMYQQIEISGSTQHGASRGKRNY